MEIAHVRILRLATGTALSMWVSQAVGWGLSFIAPVMTLFILALPLPALTFAMGVKFLAAMTLSMFASLLLLPWLLDFPLVGLLLLILALYWSFYFTAKGGSAVLGTFVTVGIALSTAVGSVSVDATLMLIAGLIMNATIGIVFVWIAHALVPDALAGGFPRPAAGKPQDAAAPDHDLLGRVGGWHVSNDGDPWHRPVDGAALFIRPEPAGCGKRPGIQWPDRIYPVCRIPADRRGTDGLLQPGGDGRPGLQR